LFQRQGTSLSQDTITIDEAAKKGSIRGTSNTTTRKGHKRQHLLSRQQMSKRLLLLLL